MSEMTHYQRNKPVILKRAKDYYENNNEILRERARINTENYLKRKRYKEAVPRKQIL